MVVVVRKFKEVADRLVIKATTRDQLLAVVDAVAAAKADTTDYDPYGTAGWRGWQMGIRRNREVHVGVSGWEKDDTDQVPSIVNPRLGLRIIVCNTDDATCIESRDKSGPQNRSKKGAATDRAVANNQGSFMEALEASLAEKVTRLQPSSRQMTSPPIVTYYLCVYVEGDDIRAELSSPRAVVNGYFDEFEERIFIIGGDAEPPTLVSRKDEDDDDGSDYPITVKRK